MRSANCLLRLCGLLATVWFPLLLPPLAAGQGTGFRVENKIFDDDDKEPRSRSTTIFCDGVAYDYLESPAEITIFDKAHGRFILLDATRRLKTELSTSHLETVNEQLQAWAAAHQDRFLQFLAHPRFEEKYNGGTGELTLESPWISYVIVTEAAEDDDDMARQYREFSDWYGRLNARINPGGRLPFPRFVVNQRLDQYDRLPTEVHLAIRPKGDRFLPDQITARSEHLWVRTLLESDRKRIAQTDEFMAVFRQVTFEEYQRKLNGPP